MSGKTGKRLKVLSTVVFCAQAVLFLALAFYFINVNLTFSFVFTALALVSALLLIPFVKMANAVCKSEQNETKEEKLSWKSASPTLTNIPTSHDVALASENRGTDIPFQTARRHIKGGVPYP